MSPHVAFAALSDPTRCRVIEMLHERPRPVHEIAAVFPISRPALSRHLRILKDAGLVSEHKQGRENIYSLERERLRLAGAWLGRLWSARLNALKAAAERKQSS